MTPTRLVLTVVAAAAVSLGAARTASADQVRYVGIHPVPAGGFCYIEGPHVHVYAPAKTKDKTRVLYRVHDGSYYFVGDPVAFGYQGPRHTYYGHHPVAVDVVVGDPRPQHEVEFCYLDGPHYHYYTPPSDISFVVDGGAYWYAGTYPPAYERDRKAYVAVNTVYEPIAYTRPVVTVAPPAVYLGPVVAVDVHGPHGHVVAPIAEVHGGVGVGVSAGVEVVVPAPTIEVGIGVPGVVVIEDDHHHHHGKGKWKGRGHRHH